MHRVLIIGVGSIGERHLRCFGATGRADLGFVETRDDLRQRIAQQYSVDASFASLDEALQRDWDAAVICTPAQLHIPMALELAQRDVHLLIEKPLSTSLEKIDDLQQVVAERKLTAAVAYIYRAMVPLQQMRATLQSGRFGAPRHLVAVCGQNFPTYRPAYREIYYRNRATGGGAIQDALTHIINASEWLVGPIDRVVADAAHLVLEGVEVEDTVDVLARQQGVLANYSFNQFQHPNEVTVSVHCDRGTVRFENHEQRWRWMDEVDGPWHDEPAPPTQRDDQFIAQADAFLDAMEGRRPVLCTVEDALQTLRVNLALLHAADHPEAGWVNVSG